MTQRPRNVEAPATSIAAAMAWAWVIGIIALYLLQFRTLASVIMARLPFGG